MSTSATAHVVVLMSVVSAARAVTPASYPRVASPLTFVRIVAAPDPAIVVPIVPFHAPEQPTDVAPAPVPEPVRMVEVERRPDPIRAPEPVRSAEVHRAPEPAPMPPAHAFEPPKPVQLAGFDAPAAHAAPVEIKRAAVGSFETAPPNARPQPGSDRANVVADAGFGAAMATAGSTAPARQVADAGFGAARVETTARSSASVKTTDFDVAPAAQPATTTVRSPHVDEAVEILNKPTPTYTDEARALKIEGDVVLDVEFTAAGDIHVLHVVRGLGHGLDEAATRAALGMRFKPARSGGRPVDFRTTVRIVFRLA